MRESSELSWHVGVGPDQAIPYRLSFQPDGAVEIERESDGQVYRATLASFHEQPDRATVLLDEWRLRTFFRYNPLIYLCAFAKTEVFECCALAIKSLRQFGHYRGDILVFTDNPTALVHAVDQLGAGPVRTVTAEAGDLLDYCATRYKILEIPGAASYQPLLYIDTDVICTQDINQLLLTVLLSGGIWLNFELKLDEPADYYGVSLLRADGLNARSDARGVSAGIMGFQHLRDVEELFPLVYREVSTVARLKGSRSWSNCYDQPVFNYVFHRTRFYPHFSLQGYVDNLLRSFEAGEVTSDKMLVHFCGNAGVTSPKLAAMKQFTRALEARRSRG